MLECDEVAERALRFWREGVTLPLVKWEFSERDTLDAFLAELFSQVEYNDFHVEYVFLSQRMMAQAVFRGAYDTCGSMAVLDDHDGDYVLWGAKVFCLSDLPNSIALVVGGYGDNGLIVAVGEATYPPEFASPVPG